MILSNGGIANNQLRGQEGHRPKQHGQANQRLSQLPVPTEKCNRRRARDGAERPGEVQDIHRRGRTLRIHLRNEEIGRRSGQAKRQTRNGN